MLLDYASDRAAILSGMGAGVLDVLTQLLTFWPWMVSIGLALGVIAWARSGGR